MQTLVDQSERTYLKIAIALGLLGLIAVLLVGKMAVATAVAVALACGVVLFFAASAVFGRLDWLLPLWVLVFPLGYYFLSFPREEKTIFSFDRFIVGLLIVGTVMGVKSSTTLPLSLRRAGTAWFFFLLAAVCSLRMMANPLGASKMVFDSFIFPGLLAWYVIKNFDVRRWLPVLHAVVCVMAIYVAAIGAAELITGQDFLELPAAVFFSPEQTGGFARVNGPFQTNDAMGLIGLITLCLLFFIRSAMDKPLSRMQRFLHVAGVACAFASAVMPMFRSMVITVIVLLLLELYFRRSFGRRLATAAALFSLFLGVLAIKEFDPQWYESRVKGPDNLYARLAQQKQTLDLFMRHPINGVGLGNFLTAVVEVPRASFRQTDSVNSAHNNLASVLAETGLFGFIPYLVAQVLFLRAFYQLRQRRTPASLQAWRYLLYIFLCYWISGLTLTAGYYSDLNMWFMFCVALIYKHAITEPLPIAHYEPRFRTEGQLRRNSLQNAPAFRRKQPLVTENY